MSVLEEIRTRPGLLDADPTAMARNLNGISKAALVAAHDAAAVEAVLTPSARGEAPSGHGHGRRRRRRDVDPVARN